MTVSERCPEGKVSLYHKEYLYQIYFTLINTINVCVCVCMHVCMGKLVPNAEHNYNEPNSN